MNRSLARILVANAVYQSLWFICVLGAAWKALPLAMPLAVLAVTGLVLAADSQREGIRQGCIALGLGVVVEFMAWRLGLYSWQPGDAQGTQFAFWLLPLWAGFGAGLGTMMPFLRGRPSLAAVLGALGGPVAYAAGARLGAVTVPEPLWGYGILSVLWAVALWTLARGLEPHPAPRQEATP